MSLTFFNFNKIPGIWDYITIDDVSAVVSDLQYIPKITFNMVDDKTTLQKWMETNKECIDFNTLLMNMLYGLIINPNRELYGDLKQEMQQEMKHVDVKKRYILLTYDDKTELTVLQNEYLREGRVKPKENSRKLEKLQEGISPYALEHITGVLNLGHIDRICEKRNNKMFVKMIKAQIISNSLSQIGRSPGYLSDRVNEADIDDYLPILMEEDSKASEIDKYRESKRKEMAKAIKEWMPEIDLGELLLCSLDEYFTMLNVYDFEDTKLIEEIKARVTKIKTYLIDNKYTTILKKIDKDKFERFTEHEYMGQATIRRLRNYLLYNVINLNNISQDECNYLELKDDEKIILIGNDQQNYINLIRWGQITPELIKNANENLDSIFIGAIKALYETQKINTPSILALSAKEKINLTEVLASNISIAQDLSTEIIYEECQHPELIPTYKEVLEQLPEKLQEIRDDILNNYFDNYSYLATFIILGLIHKEDLEGAIGDEEWQEALEQGQISGLTAVLLQEQGFVSNEATEQEWFKNAQLDVWMQGEYPTEEMTPPEIKSEDLEKILDKGDEGEYKGQNFARLLGKKPERFIKWFTKSCEHGRWKSIRPALIYYNSNLINRDRIIELIQNMRTDSSEIVEACTQGFLQGEKIAELYYKKLIPKSEFAQMKKDGLVSDDDEIKVLNNLTSDEMLEMLEDNGCQEVRNMEDILSTATAKSGIRSKSNETQLNTSRKRVINPIARHKVLAALNPDKIVITPKQGFKGYQVYLFPALRIAVMEKMFRTNKEGEAVFNYGDATYVCEMDKFLQVAGESKREIQALMDLSTSSIGHVEIVQHRNGWGSNLLDTICKVNPQIQKELNEKGELVTLTVNGKERNEKGELVTLTVDAAKLGIDIEQLNLEINRIKTGGYDLELEKCI